MVPWLVYDHWRTPACVVTAASRDGWPQFRSRLGLLMALAYILKCRPELDQLTLTQSVVDAVNTRNRVGLTRRLVRVIRRYR